jgi:hypothetical protein
MPEIRKMQVISTKHISKETADWLESIDFRVEGPSGGPNSYGWVLYAHEEPISLGRPGEPNGELPADLFACMTAARRNGCDFIKLDSDGPHVDGLESWDW